MIPNEKTYNLIKILQLVKNNPSKHSLIVLLNPLSKKQGSTTIDSHLAFLSKEGYVDLVKIPLSGRRFSICVKALPSLYNLDIDDHITLDKKLLLLLNKGDSLQSWTKQSRSLDSTLEIKDHKIRRLATLDSKKNQLSGLIQSNRYELTGSDFSPLAYDGVGNTSQNLTSSDFAPFIPVKKGTQDAE